jgi:hypothetical protein
MDYKHSDMNGSDVVVVTLTVRRRILSSFGRQAVITLGRQMTHISYKLIGRHLLAERFGACPAGVAQLQTTLMVRQASRT